MSVDWKGLLVFGGVVGAFVFVGHLLKTWPHRSFERYADDALRVVADDGPPRWHPATLQGDCEAFAAAVEAWLAGPGSAVLRAAEMADHAPPDQMPDAEWLRVTDLLRDLGDTPEGRSYAEQVMQEINRRRIGGQP